MFHLVASHRQPLTWTGDMLAPTVSPSSRSADQRGVCEKAPQASNKVTRRCSSHASVTWRPTPTACGPSPPGATRGSGGPFHLPTAHRTPLGARSSGRQTLLQTTPTRRRHFRPPPPPTKPILLRRRLSFSAARRGSGRGSRRRGVSRGSAEVFVGD
ncbi:hypothetical protein PVAP13_5NG170973 [Panicum virgatum]|uniref:Uncharacterized protein n=1 Tax=Panicum virgatum TaxID=38727 RepID=A0A8T0S9F9_PANVG|nr:hypothetical protein PVAP13_5NG170973 [Panicum virgatum]